MTWAVLIYQDITCPSASPVTDMDPKCSGVPLCSYFNKYDHNDDVLLMNVVVLVLDIQMRICPYVHKHPHFSNNVRLSTKILSTEVYVVDRIQKILAKNTLNGCNLNYLRIVVIWHNQGIPQSIYLSLFWQWHFILGEKSNDICAANLLTF